MRRMMAVSALAVCTALAAGQAGAATCIPDGSEVAGLRNKMSPDEGYLGYHLYSPYGEERSGWTDIRHPAMDGTEDKVRGYDRSDYEVKVYTHKVNAPGGNSTVTAELRRMDFDVSNAALAQAGISVVATGHKVTDGNNIVKDAADDVEPSLSELFGKDRAGGIVVNQYYVDNIPGAEGYAMPPNYAASGGWAAKPGVTYNNGFAIADTAHALPNNGSATFAHELTHFLLDDHFFGAPDRWHSVDADDLMLTSPIDPNPNAHKIQAEKFGLREPGKHVGNIGTCCHLDEHVSKGGTDYTQVQAMHRSPHVSHDHSGYVAGDVADFDWVEDNWDLERHDQAADAHDGIEAMVWQIGLVLEPSHTGHDHDAWGKLALPQFAGESFRVCDVVSQICRYADMDTAGEEWSERRSALDYAIPWFSDDGQNWVEGTLLKVFKEGWTLASKAENYVARFQSPIDAKYVRIIACNGAGYDGNCQIDAIIVPEPGMLSLLALGGLALLRRKRGYGA